MRGSNWGEPLAVEKVSFTVNRQKCRLILTVNMFQDSSKFIISADLHGHLAPEESLIWKN